MTSSKPFGLSFLWEKSANLFQHSMNSNGYGGSVRIKSILSSGISSSISDKSPSLKSISISFISISFPFFIFSCFSSSLSISFAIERKWLVVISVFLVFSLFISSLNCGSGILLIDW